MAERVVIRQPAAMRLYVLGFGIVWCGFLVTFLLDTGSPLPVLMLAFGATIVYRTVRLGVFADVDGLRVRNNFSTKRFAWSEVEDFRLGPPSMGLPVGKVIHVLLRDGTIMALDVTTRPFGRAKLERNLVALRSWLSAGSR
jgi:hypothetical protein